MDPDCSETLNMSTAINKVSQAFKLQNRLPIIKPAARIKPNLKIAPANIFLNMDYQQFTAGAELNNGTYRDASSIQQRRERYSPQCEPITPEPIEELVPRPNNRLLDNQYVDFILNGEKKEILDALVILSEEYRRRVHFMPPREKQNYPS